MRTLSDIERRNLERARDDLRARLDSGERFADAESYYATKDALRDVTAQLRGIPAHQVDPAGFWFGRQT